MQLSSEVQELLRAAQKAAEERKAHEALAQTAEKEWRENNHKAAALVTGFKVGDVIEYVGLCGVFDSYLYFSK